MGDFIIENNRIRIVVQDKGFSRGFGIYGGEQLTLTALEPVNEATPGEGRGRDQFGELLPIAFLQALEPNEVVLNDGADGQPARIKVSGEGNDLITLTKVLNQVLLNSHELPESLLMHSASIIWTGQRELDIKLSTSCAGCSASGYCRFTPQYQRKRHSDSVTSGRHGIGFIRDFGR